MTDLLEAAPPPPGQPAIHETVRRDLVIGIDCSTSATKAIAWDRDGEAAGAGRVEISLSNPKPGHFEQDPAAWWGSLTQALELLFAAVDPARVAGLAISNQRETFGFFDPDGTALAPATLWLDERARRQVERFGAEFGGARLHAISGKPLDIIPCLFRIIWFREHQPELVARAARIAEVHAFLAFHLTGRWATSIASADPTGLIDMRAMTWSDEILAAAGIPRAALPDLVRPGGLIGSVTAQAAAATGLLPGTPVIAGGGDGQCAGTGAGVLTPGRAYVNLGTAMVSGLYGRRYLYDVSFRTETAIAEEGYIYETCLRSGTFLVDWVMRELLAGRAAGADDFRALEAEAATSPVGAGGVVFLPYLQGVMDAALGQCGARRAGRPVGLLAPRRHLPGCAGRPSPAPGRDEPAGERGGRRRDRPFRRHRRGCGLRSLAADPGRRHRPPGKAGGDGGGLLAWRGDGRRRRHRLVSDHRRCLGGDVGCFVAHILSRSGAREPLPRTARHSCRSLARPCRLEPAPVRFRGAGRWLSRPTGTR